MAVPGSVAGLCLALQRYGTMELRDVMAPAIALARDGFETDWYLALNHAKSVEELVAFPATAKNYLRDGRYIYRPAGMQPGDRSTYPDLARSLQLIAKDGPDAFYRGAIAQAIASDMAANGGLITREDLARYQVLVEPALTGRYRDVDLAFSPGPTGGATALEILNILGEFPSAKVGWQTVEGLHLRARAIARGFRDRFEHLGDPTMVKVPFERLLSKAYAREVAAEIRRGKPAPAKTPRRTDECTTHLSVIDKQRNMVALTNTAVSLWGSRVVVPGTGILLNNGMIWFDPEPGKANSVGSGKRGLVNMVPVLGFRRGARRVHGRCAGWPHHHLRAAAGRRQPGRSKGHRAGRHRGPAPAHRGRRGDGGARASETRRWPGSPRRATRSRRRTSRTRRSTSPVRWRSA